jgi:hypothetical protein
MVGDIEMLGQRWRLMEPRDIQMLEDDDDEGGVLDVAGSWTLPVVSLGGINREVGERSSFDFIELSSSALALP